PGWPAPCPWGLQRSTPWLMSGDCPGIADNIPQELPANMYSLFLSPFRLMTSRGIFCTSRYVSDFTSPANPTWPVVTKVSQATLDLGSKAKKLSIKASEI